MRLIYVNSSKVTKLEQKMNNSESFLLLLKNLLKCTYEVLLPSQRYGQPKALSQKVPSQQPKPNLKQYVHKVNRHQNRHQTQSTENHNRNTALERSVMNYWGGGGGLNRFYCLPTTQSLSKMVQRFSWLFGLL